MGTGIVEAIIIDFSVSCRIKSFKDLTDDSFFAISTDGTKTSMIATKGGTLAGFSSDTLTVDVKVPEFKIPEIKAQIIVNIGNDELRNYIQDVVDKKVKMTFYDRSKIFPPPNNGIKLQEFDNNGPTGANEHGIDGSGTYAENKAAVLCFLCDYHFSSALSNRLVTFKGFIEDLQFKLNIGNTEEGGSNFSPITEKYLKGYKFGYNLTFNVVAHSVNDAVSNMARYSELERILMYPFTGPRNPGAVNQSIRIPSAYVFMSNLINNGLLGYNNKYEKNSNNQCICKKTRLEGCCIID